MDIVVDIASPARRVMISADRGMILNHGRINLGENVVKDRIRKDKKTSGTMRKST